MVGVAGGGVGSAAGPIRKAGGGGGGGCCRFMARYEKRAGGRGGGVLSVSGPNEERGGGGGVLSVSGPKRRAGGGVLSVEGRGGGGGGGYDRISGGPGYSTVVEFMRADIFPLGLLSRSCSESCPKTFCWDQTLNIHHCMHELLPHNKGYVFKVQVLL